MTTDWTRYDVPTIASFLNEDLGTSWSQVLAWEQTFSLLNGHSSRLSLARDSLAESWPPDQSPASSAFMANVDQMVSSMADTADAAIINRDALMGVLSALESARVSVDQLHDKWHFYTDQEAINSTPHMLQVRLPDNWRQKLNAEAQATMAATDQAIFESTQKMVVPSTTVPVETYRPIPGPGSAPSAGPPQISSRSQNGSGTYLNQTLSGQGASAREAPGGIPTTSTPIVLPQPTDSSAQPPLPVPSENVPPGGEIRMPTDVGSAIIGAGLSTLPIGLKQVATRPPASAGSIEADISRRTADESTVTGGSNSQEGPLGAPIAPGVMRPGEGQHTIRARKTTKWHVPVGVIGLIVPVDPEQDFDLGPGVIGVDR